MAEVKCRRETFFGLPRAIPFILRHSKNDLVPFRYEVIFYTLNLVNSD